MFAETRLSPWRVRQIRLTGAVLGWLGQISPIQRFISFIRIAPISRGLYRLVVGYQRPFVTLAEAEAAVSAYARQGHINPANCSSHLDINKTARPSDYAALFHLQRIIPSVRRLFDLGGNVGNLFYCYVSYLDLPVGFTWQVQDLPENMAHGRTIALERNAKQLSFANDWSEANGTDLLLISGALHYIEETLESKLSKLKQPPEYIIINRTPITDGASFATIQDGGPFRVACMVHNRQSLLQELERAGYQLEDSWHATELAIRTPADPNHTVPHYSGFFLRRAGLKTAGI